MNQSILLSSWILTLVLLSQFSFASNNNTIYAGILTCEVTLDDNVSCAGANDGTATVTATGGDTNYSYHWDNDETNQTVSNLSPGLHTVTVTDGLSSTTTCNIMITEPEELTASISTTDALCYDSNLGIATVTPTGGTSPYTYVWSNGEAENPQINLTPGNYTVTVTDFNDCQTVESCNISGPNSAITTTIEEISNATCEGQENGSVTLSTTGGTSPYTYYWPFDGTYGPTQENLPTGNYMVEITDANDCLSLFEIEIEFEFTLTLAFENIISAGCEGSNTGSATVIADNGTPNYTYAWSNDGTGSTQDELSPDTYNVTATDANGCTVTGSIEITAEDTEAPFLTQDTFTVSLDIMGNGILTVDDISPYAIDNCGIDVIEAISTNYDCSDFGINTLEVHLYDINGNNTTVTIIVNVIDEIAPTTSCPENINSNSCSAITYTIPTGEDNCTIEHINLIDGLPSGDVFPVGTTTVTYELIDQSGNSSNCSFDVNITSNLSLEVIISDVSCYAGNDGSATITANGGTEPYIYTYDGSLNLNQLSAGEYSITVTDNAGCTTESTINISEPDAIEVETIITNATCFNYNDGSVEFNITGGTAPYEINFMNGLDYTMLEAQDYSYEIVDANGCSTNNNLTITQPEILIITEHIITNATANDTNDGSIEIEIEGGTPPYSYSWILDGDVVISNEKNLTNAFPGNYTCEITDSNGCSFFSLEWIIDFKTAVSQNFIDDSVIISPNPNNGLFTVGMSKANSQNINIRILSSNGKLINQSSSHLNNGKIDIDISTMQVGLYFIQLETNDKVITKKVFLVK